MRKKITLSFSFLVLVMLGIVGANVFAQTPTTTSATTPIKVRVSTTTSPMILNISPTGNALMRGVVESVNTDSIVVESWGGSWKVQFSSTTNILSTNKNISDFQAGDFVGVLGNIASDGSFAIDASIVRKWGQKADSDDDGISDDQDNDDDNDGISDLEDVKKHDHDNDGEDDDEDEDDDDDGIEDDKDSHGRDHDNDGIRDSRDSDDDNDDISDLRDSKPRDHDNDGEDDDEDEDDDSEEEDEEDEDDSDEDGSDEDDN